MVNEPMILKGICKDYIWGGNRLRDEFGRESQSERIAESWELACHKDGSSIIMNGIGRGMNLREYINKYGNSFLGTKCRECETLPVMIKLIDAKENLSIQVHPDDEYAMRAEGEYGKTEMWYIIDAEPDASLYYGMKKEISKEEFAARIADNTLTEVLNRVNVKRGELYFIPSGTIHAIGAGILLAEIQQNSNTTYRVYDYGRIGNDGKPRELHIEKAMDVADMKPMKPINNYPEKKTEGGSIRKLEHCGYFCSDLIKVESEAEFSTDETTFNHILVLSGSGCLKTASGIAELSKGSSVLIPANTGNYSACGCCEYILTYV